MPSDHLSDLAWHNQAGVEQSLSSEKMRAGSSVVVGAGGQNVAQIALVKYHRVIHALAATRTDHTLDASVLRR